MNDTQQIYSHVAERYSAASRGTALEYGHTVAKAFGYSEQELAATPKESNLGLSCGNPVALASIREGETVIDLGSGAGFDAFLVASRVGQAGKVIGVDMNKDMLARANEIKNKHDKHNVTFVDSQITDMSAIPSSTADCIISNCVINLVPEADKPLVFREMHRLLKPGGRIAISDILAKRPLPAKLRANMALYVGCVSGASLVEQYRTYLQEAGFAADSVVISDDGADLNVYLETNPDGTRTAGGTGGNLCCNPSIASTPAKNTKMSCCSTMKTNEETSPCSVKTTETSYCSGTGDKPLSASTSCCSSEVKSGPDAAIKEAAAEASSSCCSGANVGDQAYAFDAKDLADLEGEDLNTWAGEFELLATPAHLGMNLHA